MPSEANLLRFFFISFTCGGIIRPVPSLAHEPRREVDGVAEHAELASPVGPDDPGEDLARGHADACLDPQRRQRRRELEERGGCNRERVTDVELQLI